MQRFEFKNVVDNKVFWVTPGGGIEACETPKIALERELKEELGIEVKVKGEYIFQKDVPIKGKEHDFISREYYFSLFLRSDHPLCLNNMTENEMDTFKDLKWWDKNALQKRDDVAPKELMEYI